MSQSVARRGQRQSADSRQNAAILGASGNKYGAVAICACFHPRWAHQTDTSAKPMACRDVDCSCRQWRKKYDSQLEAAKGEELEALQRAGVIAQLEHHPSWWLCRKPPIRFSADFQFIDMRDGQTHVIDTKGFLSRDSWTRIAWLREQYGIVVELVNADGETWTL